MCGWWQRRTGGPQAAFQQLTDAHILERQLRDLCMVLRRELSPAQLDHLHRKYRSSWNALIIWVGEATAPVLLSLLCICWSWAGRALLCMDHCCGPPGAAASAVGLSTHTLAWDVRKHAKNPVPCQQVDGGHAGA